MSVDLCFCRGGIPTPDVLTHLLFGMSLAFVLYGVRLTEKSVLIMLGSILIDIERPLTWILMNTDLYWLDLKLATHSILGAIVLAFFAASCFNSSRIEHVSRFKLVLAGCILHLVLDMTMYPWEEIGLYLLYPLKIPFSFNIVWSDFAYFPLLGIAALLIAIAVAFLLERTGRPARLFNESIASSSE